MGVTATDWQVDVEKWCHKLSKMQSFKIIELYLFKLDEQAFKPDLDSMRRLIKKFQMNSIS